MKIDYDGLHVRFDVLFHSVDLVAFFLQMIFLDCEYLAVFLLLGLQNWKLVLLAQLYNLMELVVHIRNFLHFCVEVLIQRIKSVDILLLWLLNLSNASKDWG